MSSAAPHHLGEAARSTVREMTSSLDGPRLAGRRVVVTGAGSGIGLACALRLGAEGACVAATDLRQPLAASAADRIVDLGGRAIACAADVADERSIGAAVAQAAGEWDGLDAIVTCAGIVHSVATDAMSLDLWELVLRVNLTGTFLAVKHGLPHLLAAGGGSIVTVGSVASVVAGGSASCYDASKGGVLQFTRAVAAEYADRNIRANCVCPGAVRTNLRAHSQEAVETASLTGGGTPGALRVKVPMDRHADPGEIGGVVAFLCSDDASFMTGTAVMVDGGFTAI